MPTFRILSLDGGGVRGVITARLLERLEAECPGCLARADLIAGTSAGGVLALGLAQGLTPQRCRALVEENAPLIFPRWFPYNQRWYRALRQFFRALYDNDELETAMRGEFGDRQLKDLQHRVLITTFDLNGELPKGVSRWKPKFFHNFPTRNPAHTDAEEKVVNVAMRTSAAPTFMPIYEDFVDGGVVANNPSMCALAQALHAGTGQQQLTDVVLLSLGTGVDPIRITAPNAHWGIAHWFLRKVKLTDALIGGVEDVAEYQCRQVLRDRFHRLNPLLCGEGMGRVCEVSLDDSEAIPALVDVAGRLPLEDPHYIGNSPKLKQTVDWLKHYWMN
jgi:patatin-like phospholipase/acyl hydrolase